MGRFIQTCGYQMLMWIKLLTAVIVFPAIILAGCTSTPNYQAKATTRSDAAIVRGWESDGVISFTYTEIDKVDGLRLSVWSQTGGALIDPGLRVLSVAGNYAGGFGGIERYTGRGELDVTLKAADSYRIKAERSGARMTLWVEDEETHEVVSERLTTNTIHWINWL